jgi:glyoxylase-like metal-dependent hydrolase (beta-lactamase superfamily II)
MSFPLPERRLFQPLDLPDLWRYEDCCNVYVLRHGDRALLIDLGSGEILDRLPEIGVRQVEGVYFTHAHRDQCAGAERSISAGIPLHFPTAARDFVDPERRADLRGPSPLVRRYPGRFDPPPPFPCRDNGVFFDVAADQRLPSGEWELETQPAPGHLDHQVAYLLDIAGRRLCFSGDALHSPGKIHEAYHWENDHYTGGGLRLGIETLRTLRHHRPDALLPSHGPVTQGDLWRALLESEAALRELAERKDTIIPGRPAVRRLVPPRPMQLQQVSPHLYLWNNSYFLVSDAGPVLMVDNAAPLPTSFWEQYRAALGDRPITAVLVTHIHLDHVEGVEDLRKRGWGGEVWTHAALADCIENPLRYRRPWLCERGIRVDRRLEEGERFTFHEHELTAYFAPGQTDLHACYPLQIDGHPAILSGDNFYPAQQWGGTGGLCGLNGGHPDGWRRTLELYLKLAPEWVLASHIHPFEYREEDFRTMLRWCDDVSAAMRAVAPDGNLERHHIPHTFNLEPYAQEATSGEPLGITGSFHNPYDRQISVAARLVTPGGWQVEPASWQVPVAPGEVAKPEWQVTAALGAEEEHPTLVVTADLVYDGAYLGEKAECYVTLTHP